MNDGMNVDEFYGYENHFRKPRGKCSHAFIHSFNGGRILI